MSRRLKPLPVLEGDQRLASDPSGHAALSASAGTGKTQVLTARVLRLLLQGTPPQAILCLTFTKAGAAEMANRLGERLARWVRMDEEALRHDLFALGEDRDPPALQRARRLFARVIEAPGGLRIQTIHAFAQTLLASFPAEAGIVPGFQPIEGRAETELARKTLAALLVEAEAGGDHTLIADVQALSLRLGEQGAETYLMDCAHADPVAIGLFAVPGAAEAWLHREMKLPDGSIEEFLSDRCGDDGFDCDLLRAIAAANQAWGGKTGAGHAESIERWLAMAPADRAAALPDLALVAFTQKGDLRKVAVGQTKADPAYQAHVDRLAEAVGELLDYQRGAAFAAAAAAGLRAGAAFAAAYARAKRAAGVADFNDLIRWTRGLLQQDGMGPWIRFKLDRQTDHVLVDEAQDTNADQWAIVDALIDEYFSGSAEADGRSRTLFMVGDYKQAIYRFQGSDPQRFDDYRKSIALRAAGMDAAAGPDGTVRPFRDLSISASFRSSQAVLDVVDAVIGEVGARSMGLGGDPGAHIAFHADRPGSVELWPPFIAEAAARGDDDDAGDEGWIDKPLRHYADRIARQVRAWIDEAPVMASTGGPLAPGDILILVRSRTELASLIVARLYEQHVAVAGIDRLHLAKPLAVKDLISAIAFAVQPHDDLNLAGLLVSPLVGLDQEELFALAYARGGSLWSALRDRRDAPYVAAQALLAGLLEMADFVTPARYLATILSGPIDGRRKLLARLGEEARDPIEELLSSALEFEAQETPSLDRFLAWFASGDVEIKRDASAPSNAVRVMTVHGAKGLEAPLVILADATHDPARTGGNRSVMDMTSEGGDAVPLVRPRADERVAPFRDMIEEAKRLDLEEHWRLLYVGLTRAAERLVIAGVMPRHGVVPNSWHARAVLAMAAMGAEPFDSPLWGEGMRWAKAGGAAKTPRRAPIDLGVPLRPDWLDRAAPIEETPPRPLAPSALGDHDSAPPPSPELRAAARRGTLLHALFERLPGAAADGRQALALAWLERAGVADPGERAEIAAAALRVIEDPQFADLFAADALAEAPIAATLADGRVIAGTIDRLCIGDTLVRVVDFKTGRGVPADAASVPDSHRAQMKAYAEALKVIFPGRRVEAALLYTHAPRLILLDG
ncbi:MAG: double-strand break repair helicase AddA [Sphingomicrobium sp.]